MSMAVAKLWAKAGGLNIHCLTKAESRTCLAHTSCDHPVLQDARDTALGALPLYASSHISVSSHCYSGFWKGQATRERTSHCDTQFCAPPKFIWAIDLIILILLEIKSKEPTLYIILYTICGEINIVWALLIVNFYTLIPKHSFTIWENAMLLSPIWAIFRKAQRKAAQVHSKVHQKGWFIF